jgi:hypothetical protein
VLADMNFFMFATNTPANTNASPFAPTNWLTLRPNSLLDTNLATNAGVTVDKLSVLGNALVWGNTNAAGSNAAGGALLLGSHFTVSVNSNKTASATNTGATLMLACTNSGEIGFPGVGGRVDYGHTIGHTPSRIEVRAICKTEDVGYKVGDEVQLSSLYQTGPHMAWTIGCNTTNVFCVRSSAASDMGLFNKTDGANDTITTSRWRIKFYAWP